MGLSRARASTLRSVLDAFRDARPLAERVRHDPVWFPRQYRASADVEVAGLLASSLAYGRVGLFMPRIAAVLEALGPSPARGVVELSVAGAARAFAGFTYRFNRGSDLAVLLLGMGEAIRRDGSLEVTFRGALERAGSWRGALSGFVRRLRALAPEREIVGAMGPARGVHHLLPGAEAGAAKRLNLYLRWMVRGPDPVDLGVWRSLSPAQLIMPVDTHIARVGRLLGLTRRATVSWAMAEEITASLRQLDPDDPVKYDFVLCHYGMSGACPLVPRRQVCQACALRSQCTRGRSLA